MSLYESGQMIALVMDRVDAICALYADAGIEVSEVRLVNGECNVDYILPGHLRYMESTIEVVI